MLISEEADSAPFLGLERAWRHSCRRAAAGRTPPLPARRPAPRDWRFSVKRFLVLAVSAAFVCVGFAQQPGRGAAPAAGRGMGGGRGPAVVSPEVHPDRTVTLRIVAPLAKS